MKKLLFITRYIKYYLVSKTRYTIHSDFVYKFVNSVLRDKTKYDDYIKLWDSRYDYSVSNDTIETVDFGSSTGKRSCLTKILSLKKIVKLRTHPKKRLELLYRIAREYKPKSILEFGTAVGISSSYLKLGSPDSTMVSMEGCANLASKASELHEKLDIEGLRVAVGNFDNNLEKELAGFSTLDMVFFDGNHKEEPTLRYYEACAKLINENSIFVFDDIHWSTGMENSWEQIKKDKRVSITIDLFWFGIVFFRKGIEKQNFIIRY